MANKKLTATAVKNREMALKAMELVKAGLTVENACQQAGTTPANYYSWRARILNPGKKKKRKVSEPKDVKFKAKRAYNRNGVPAKVDILREIKDALREQLLTELKEELLNG